MHADFWKDCAIYCNHGFIIIVSPSLCPSPRFQSSNDATALTSLEEYLERMKEKQEHIYFMAAPNRQEAESSPFVERLLRKGYEVLYLVEPVDEYCIQVGRENQ